MTPFSNVRNKFGYNVMTARITTPDLYCSASRKPITWTQKAPMHRWTVNQLEVWERIWCILGGNELV